MNTFAKTKITFRLLLKIITQSSKMLGFVSSSFLSVYRQDIKSFIDVQYGIPGISIFIVAQYRLNGRTPFTCRVLSLKVWLKNEESELNRTTDA